MSFKLCLPYSSFLQWQEPDCRVICRKGIGHASIFRGFGVGMVLLFICAIPPHLRAAVPIPQEPGLGGGAEQSTQKVPKWSPDFEAKVDDGGLLVRRKGTQEWKQSSKLAEPIVLGSFGSNQKIYVVTKAIKPPKARYAEGLNSPPGESGRPGRVLMLVVVDQDGAVRFPTVKASSGPEFTKAAIEAVKRWTFEPGNLDGEAVAVMILVTVDWQGMRKY
jgi:TonB family protein